MSLYLETTKYLKVILPTIGRLAFDAHVLDDRATFTCRQGISIMGNQSAIVVLKTIDIASETPDSVRIVLWYRQARGRSGHTPWRETADAASPKRIQVGSCTSMAVFLNRFLPGILEYISADPELVNEIAVRMCQQVKKDLPKLPSSSLLSFTSPRVHFREVRGKYLESYGTSPVTVREQYVHQQLFRGINGPNNPLEIILSAFTASHAFTVIKAKDSTGLMGGLNNMRNVKNCAWFWIGINKDNRYTVVVNPVVSLDGKTIHDNITAYAAEELLNEVFIDRMFSSGMPTIRLPRTVV